MFWEKIDNSKLLNVYKQKRLVPMFTSKDFYGWFQLCLLLNPFQNDLYFLDDFPEEFYRKFVSNNFCKQTWAQSCLCPFNN